MNGSERYLTLGCGHTAAFCKFALAGGGVTSEESLKDEHGMLALHKVKSNPTFNTMINDGWEWEVVCAAVDEAFPWFAKVAQKALNTSNHVATEVGELEAMVTLADAKEDGVDDEAAVASIVDLNIPCSKYAKVLLTFVKMYGGGVGAPWIRFMDSVAKQFQCNITLGETFWTTICKANFPGDITCMKPLTRVALCLCNLQTDKVSDGIAQLVKVADITKLSSKGCADKAKCCEDTVRNAVIIEEAIAINLGHDSDKLLQPMGQIFVRAGLVAIGKSQKDLGEELDYKIIKKLFLQGVSSIAGSPVTYEPWAMTGDAVVDASMTENADMGDKSSGLHRADELTDPLWIAERAGFTVGITVHDKAIPNSIFNGFEIEAIGSHGVSLKKIEPYDQPVSSDVKVFRSTITLAEMMHGWGKSSLQMPLKCSYIQHRPAQLSLEYTRCKLFQILMDTDVMNKAAPNLSFWKKPDMVRTADKIAAGALTLVPMTIPSNIVTKAANTHQQLCSGKAYSLGKHKILLSEGGENEFFVIEPTKCATGDVGVLPLIAAFWWVGVTSTPKEANMEFVFKEVKGVSIPLLKNHVELKPNVRLMRYVKPEAAAKKNPAVCTGPSGKKRKSAA